MNQFLGSCHCKLIKFKFFTDQILDELYKVRNKIISDIDLKKIKKIYINKSKLDYNDTDKLNYYAEEAVKYKKIVANYIRTIEY